MASGKIIGVMPLYDDEKESIWMLPAYMEGIYEAGGLPIILPTHMTIDELESIDDICSGYLFTGGHDIDPKLYGAEKSDRCGMINASRDLLEKMVFEKAYDEDKPIFGICRGIQLINVLLGGNLYQDLPSEKSCGISHQMKPPYDRTEHKVKIFEDTWLYEILGTNQTGVNSYHHQAIKDVGKGLMAMAESDDGIIEAVEAVDKRFIKAVQWHPEYMADEASKKLFSSFVKACM
ncbi:putative glutamine amidotransferase [Clostridiales bacterium]|nr:putative glutamine amidotransferase [Clostridiales bacterium]